MVSHTKTHTVKLRVWPNRGKSGKRGCYYDVHIYPTKRMWIDGIRKNHNVTRKRLSEVGAIFVTSHLIDGKQLRWGYLYFYHDQFWHGNIAHECTHAALDYCYWKKINPLDDGDGEETLATVVGDLYGQIQNAIDDLDGKPKGK